MKICPWEEAAERRPRILIGVGELPAGIYGVHVPDDRHPCIVLSNTIDDEKARETLAHELVHNSLGPDHDDAFYEALNLWLDRIRLQLGPAPVAREFATVLD